MFRGGAVSAVVKALVPSLCLYCNAGLAGEDRGLCAACWSTVAPITGSRCPRCGNPSDDADEDCISCLDAPVPQTGTVVWGEYSGVLRQALLAMKHRGHDELAQHLGRRLSESLSNHPWIRDIDAVTHVPSHFAHRIRRGYSAANLLADNVARELDLPRRRTLKRRGFQRQAGLSRARRLRMPQKSLQPRSNIQPMCLLIIDDVTTTGTTLRLAAKTLRSATGKPVYCATIAWAPGPRRTHEFI